MPGNFDIQTAAREILSVGRIVEVETLGPDSGALDARDSSALIAGDALAGAVVRGARSLLIQGSIAGEADRPCRIEVGGDVVVLGSARHAQIAAHNIRIGAEGRNCRLAAKADVWVGSDLADTRVTAGASDAEEQVGRLRQRIRQAARDRETVERQLRADERRVEKLLVTTRFVYKFNIGRIVRRRDGRLQIDLQPFYDVSGDRTDEQIDRALLEFFAKAVVGLLTRINRAAIQDNPGRQKVFLGTIRALHDLFVLTRKRDRQSKALSGAETDLEKLVESLSVQAGTVHVRGVLQPHAELRFVIPDVVRREDGGVAVDMHAATLVVRAGAEAGRREVVQVDRDGEESVSNVGEDELRGITVRVQEGRTLRERADRPSQ